MADKIVVDTNVLIDATRRRDAAGVWLTNAVAAHRPLAVSAVTVAEYISGIAPSHEREARAFLA